MNTYSRALHRINMKDVKIKHQQKLIEQKIQEEKKKEEEKYIASVMEEKKYDWREKLNEGMTSSETFFTTLPATGDLTISSNDFSDPDTYLFSSSVSGTDVLMVSTEDSSPIESANYTNLRQVRTGNIDSSKSTTIVVSVTKPTSDFPTWQDRDPLENFNDNISVVAYSNSNPIETSVTLSNDFNGTQSFTLPSNLRVSDLRIQFSQFGLIPVPGDPSSGQPNATIKVITTQRQTPMNVFVSLDSPEASSFIRTDPMMSNLSPEERRQKLKEMLEASDEYVEKMLGLDFPGTGSIPPGEYDPFKQAPAGEAGDTPGVEIAGGYGLRPDGTSGMNKVGDKVYDPATKKEYELVPSKKYGGGTQWTPVRQATKASMPMVAHYKPQGQLISEKKKLKSPQEVLNKIPGYYDGKPAPLGFPVEPPPKIVNGMHPDLVDGKKIADRFNRLDPESAKATPLTGNPHIDKKVKAARKKPK
jgi:hypothetical protein